MEFGEEIPEALCKEFFQKMFGGIWEEKMLAEIIFPGGFKNTEAYLAFTNQNKKLEEGSEKMTALYFLADYFGNGLWEVFSNNHTVFSLKDKRTFSIGSWRGSGDFIAAFIEKENNSLLFDYMSFYMGHYFKRPEAQNNYEFIFKQLMDNGFDWCYEYPQTGIVDLSPNRNEGLPGYNPNKAVEDGFKKNDFLSALNRINTERKEKIRMGSTPAIILAYANTFGRYPWGWGEMP